MLDVERTRRSVGHVPGEAKASGAWRSEGHMSDGGDAGTRRAHQTLIQSLVR